MTIMKHRNRLSFAAAITLAMAAAPVPAASADPLLVYGGPTYSPSTGGYVMNDFDRLSPTAHVNDAGMAVTNAARYSSSGTPLGLRALRWSASIPVVDIGDFASKINSGGTVIGSANLLPARWAPSAATATILEHPSQIYGYASPYDLNDAGTGVGLVSRSYFNEFNQKVDLGTRAARWDGSGTALTQLGTLGTDVDGYTQAGARAINAAGSAVGNAQKYDAAGNYLGYWPVRWDASAVAATPLGHLGTSKNDPYGGPDGITEGDAFAINRVGTAVGYVNVYDDSGQFLRLHAPVRWDASGKAMELGNLGGGDATVRRSPAALNDAGTAVGWAMKLTDSGLGDSRAVRWDASGTAAIELGTLGTDIYGYATSFPWALNGSGTVVGEAEYVNAAGMPEGDHAVYWGTDTKAVDLNTLIDPNSGWNLRVALEISNTGWIVGEGLFDPDGLGGQDAYSRTFLIQVPASVPEPGAGLVLMLIGACSLARRGHRGKTPSRCV